MTATTTTKNEFFNGWVSGESAATDSIDVKRIYVDINDGYLTDGVIFSQIMFWHGSNKETGQRRMKVFKDGYWWVAKNYDDWWEECRVKARTAKESIRRIRDRKLVIAKTMLFNGVRTLHLRVNPDAFEERIKTAQEIAKDKKCLFESAENVFSERTKNVFSITKTTTETTNNYAASADEPEETQSISGKSSHDQQPSDSHEETPPPTTAAPPPQKRRELFEIICQGSFGKHHTEIGNQAGRAGKIEKGLTGKVTPDELKAGYALYYAHMTKDGKKLEPAQRLKSVETILDWCEQAKASASPVEWDAVSHPDDNTVKAMPLWTRIHDAYATLLRIPKGQAWTIYRKTERDMMPVLLSQRENPALEPFAEVLNG